MAVDPISMAYDPANFVGILGFIVVIGVFSLYLFKKYRVPDVIPLLLVGVFIMHLGYLVTPALITTASPYLAALGLIIMMLDNGLALDLYDILENTPISSKLAFAQVILTTLITVIFTNLVLGFPVAQGIFLGLIISATADDIFLPLLRELKAKNEMITVLNLESIIADTLSIVLAITVLQFIVTTETSWRVIGHTVLSAFSIGAFIGLLGGIIWSKTLDKFKNIPYGYMITIAVLFLVYSLTENFGGDGAIAILLFALVMGNIKKISKILRLTDTSGLDKNIRKFNSEISFFARTFFFVYTGMLMSITNIMMFVWGLVLTSLLALARYFAVELSLKDTDLYKQKYFITLVMPRGFTAAVLAYFPLAFGIPHAQDIANLIFVIILTSVIVTSLTMWKEGFRMVGKKSKRS